MENQAYLKEQILTYLGNKRSLLGFIEQGVNIAKQALGKEKLSCCDLFSGSGIVSRFLKSHANFIVANDLELYSRVTNECYLANADAEFKKELDFWHEKLTREIGANLREGFICELYAPKDEANISARDRAWAVEWIEKKRRLHRHRAPDYRGASAAAAARFFRRSAAVFS